MLQGFSPAFRVTLAFALGVTLTATAQTPDPAQAAQLYKEGQDLLAAGDAIHARLKFLDAAQAGSADAENEVGKLYLAGNGVDQSSDEATYWFNRSAQNGSIRGMTNLGLMYFGDRGYRADFDKAAQWLSKAAEQGQPVAMSALGTLYLNGQGVPQDYAKAFELQTKAAEQGVVDAYNELGRMYLLGAGVKQDSKTALEWFQKAADGGNVNGIANVGLMYIGDRGIPADLGKAVKWLTRAADEGQAIAQYKLALLLSEGKDGVQKNSGKAFDLFMKAAHQGVPAAQVVVGDYYLDGDDGLGIPMEPETAIEWYKAAVQSHDPQAVAEVAGRLLDPYSDIYDEDAARPLLFESAGAGNALGEYELAMEYQFDKAFTDAAKMFKASAEQGHGPALYELAQCYLKGEGVERNPLEAYINAQLAVDRRTLGASGFRDQAAKELTAAQLEEAKVTIEKKKAAWTIK